MKKIIFGFLLFGLFGLSFDVCLAKRHYLKNKSSQTNENNEYNDQANENEEIIINKTVALNLRTGKESEIDLKREIAKLSIKIAALRKKIDPALLERAEQGAQFNVKYYELLARLNNLLRSSLYLTGDALRLSYDLSIFLVYDIFYKRVIPASIHTLDQSLELAAKAGAVVMKIADQTPLLLPKIVQAIGNDLNAEEPAAAA